MKPRSASFVALLLLIGLLIGQFGWQAAEGANAWPAWSAGQGLYGAMTLALLWIFVPQWQVRAAALLGFACQALTAWCSISWLIKPWAQTGRDRCSAAFDFPVGLLAVALAAVLAWRIAKGGRYGG